MGSFAKFAALPADWTRLSPEKADATHKAGERLEVTLRFVYAPDRDDCGGAGAASPQRKERKSALPITMNLPVGVLVSHAGPKPQQSSPGTDANPRPVLFHAVVLGLLLEVAIGLSGWVSIHEFARLLHRL
jgi:hypothetical protein